MFTLRQRKAFSLRSAFSGAARAIDIEDSDAYLGGLQLAAGEQAKSAVDEPQPNEDLTTFLQHVPRLLTAADGSCVSTERRRLRRQARLRAANASCELCPVAAKLGKPCDGSDEKLEASLIESLGGRCIGEIQTSWAYARDLANDYYTKAVPGLPQVETKLEIVFRYLELPQEIPGHPLSFTAHVEFEQTRTVRRSIVQLAMAPHYFSLRCTDALLPTFLHEAFCHVWQMAAGRPPRRLDASYDSFAEGWMDYVVGVIIQQELGTNTGPLTDRYLRSANRLHSARCDLSPGGGQKSFSKAANVSRGAGAAQYVLAHCRADGGTVEQFLDLSLRLNAHPWPGTTRDAACRALKEWLPQPTVPQWNAIDRALRNAREKGDIEALIATLAPL